MVYLLIKFFFTFLCLRSEVLHSFNLLDCLLFCRGLKLNLLEAYFYSWCCCEALIFGSYI